MTKRAVNFLSFSPFACVFALFLMQGSVVFAQQKPKPTVSSVLEEAPVSAWREVSPDRLLVMTLSSGKKVMIELAPEFAPKTVSNIIKLSRDKFFDGSRILRVQDNYVTQWGRPENDPVKAKNVVAPVPSEYELAQNQAPQRFKKLKYRDSYASKIGFSDGFPVASDGRSYWLTHCYGMVAVARNNPPDTGTGEALYTVIGHSPRTLDRNLTVVGRVLFGMDYLSGLKRGTGALGFYETIAEQTLISSVSLSADLSAKDRPNIKVLDTHHAAFEAWAQARSARSEAFFVKPANAMDLCNLLPPVRMKTE